LDKLAPCGFKHNEQSLRVVDVIEKEGKGLNLTVEVRDGILNHKKSGNPMTLEGVAVSLADRIAYINHDIEDAMRAGVLKLEDLPKEPVAILGTITKERINTAITDIYKNSKDTGTVKMSEEVAWATAKLRSFMFERVYELANKSIQDRAERLLTQLFEYFMNHVEELPAPYDKLLETCEKDRVVCDYISGMTDKYAIGVFERLFIPSKFSLAEVVV
jgi:dGTPase